MNNSEHPTWVSAHENGAVLHVRAVPRAKTTSIDCIYGDTIKVRVQAPPVEGKANKALIRFFSKELGISASTIRLLTGDTGRNKHLLFTGMPPELLIECIQSKL